MERIRLMIVDDYAPIRLGLRAIFESEEDIEVVGDYGDGESAIEDAGGAIPNVVLMDVRMPGMDGVEACRLIRDAVPGTNVVMLTSFDDERAATASILAGARGFLLKNGGPGELFRVRRSAARDSLERQPRRQRQDTRRPLEQRGRAQQIPLLAPRGYDLQAYWQARLGESAGD